MMKGGRVTREGGEGYRFQKFVTDFKKNVFFVSYVLQGLSFSNICKVVLVGSVGGL